MAQAFNAQAADDQLENHLRVIGQSVQVVDSKVVALQKMANSIRAQEAANRQKLSAIEEQQKRFREEYKRDNEELKKQIANLQALIEQNAAQTAETAAHVAAMEAAERRKQLEAEKLTALSTYINAQSTLFDSLTDNAVRVLHVNYCLQRFAELNIPESFSAHLADLDVATMIVKKFQDFMANAGQATIDEAQRIFNASIDAQDIDAITRRIESAVGSMHGNMQSSQQAIANLENKMARDEEQVVELAKPESTSDHRSRVRQSIVWLLTLTCIGVVSAVILTLQQYPAQAAVTAIVGFLLGLFSAYIRWTARRRKTVALPLEINRLHERIDQLNKQGIARHDADLASITALFQKLQSYRPDLATSQSHSEQDMVAIAERIAAEAQRALAAAAEPHPGYGRIKPPSRQYVGALYHGRVGGITP